MSNKYECSDMTLARYRPDNLIGRALAWYNPRYPGSVPVLDNFCLAGIDLNRTNFAKYRSTIAIKFKNNNINLIKM